MNSRSTLNAKQSTSSWLWVSVLDSSLYAILFISVFFFVTISLDPRVR